MRLERLEISGFKSFSDRSELSFDQGVTAIVGPNGCGKSNVADALTWVLGEQSARSLRGETMEDVIFNGSDARKPTGAAEVRLRLSGVVVPPSVDKELGYEPPLTTAPGQQGSVTLAALDITREVEVTRRLFRSGDSEYLIDGQQCRLKDIHELLMDTGLGAKAYAIIEQGKIGMILSARPTDRRQLIEEAAGVTRYRARRRSAELKLDAARQNLARLDDIVYEVDRQKGALRRQAARARRYTRLRDEMRRWEKVLFARRHRSLKEAIEAARTRLTDVREQEAAAAARLAEVDTTLAALRLAQAEADGVAGRLRDLAHSQELDINRRQQQIALDRQQAAMLTGRADELEAERQQLEGRREPGRLALDERRQAVEEAARRRRDAAATAQEAADACARTQLAIEAAEHDVDHARAEVYAVVNTVTALTATLQSATTQRERAVAADQRLAVEQGDLAVEFERAQADRAAAREHLRRAEEALDAARLERRRCEDLLAHSRRAFDQHTRDVRAGEQQLAGLSARLRSLEELVADRAGFGDAARLVLSSSATAIGARGALVDFLDVDSRYERAVEACLGDLLQHVVVSSVEQVSAGLQLVRAENAGRCGFIIARDEGESAGTAPAAVMPAGVVPLTDVVRIQGECPATIRRVLGDVCVADTFETAAAATQSLGATVVTLDGDVFRGRYQVSGGAKAESRGLLATKREIKELRERIAEERVALARLADEAVQVEQVVAEASAGVQRLGAEMHRQEKAMVAAEAQEHRAAQDAARVAQRRELVEADIRRVRDEISALDVRQAEARDSIARLAADKRIADERFSEQVLRLTAAREQAEQGSQRVAGARADLAAFTERLSALEQEVVRLETAATELERRLAACQRDIALMGEQRDRLIEGVGDHERQLDDDVRLLDSLREQVRETDDRAGELRTSVEAQDQVIRDARRALDAVRALASELDVSRATAEADLTHLAQQACDAVGVTLEDIRQDVEAMDAAGIVEPDVRAIRAAEAVEPDEDESAAETGPAEAPVPERMTAEEAITVLRGKVDRIGPVNMMAIEQHAELEQRYVFLTTQRQDLLESIAQTTEAIRRIDETTHVRFREAFTAINLNFQDTFSTLFGGGKAGVRLIDDTDPLDSGIDIVASPPGKRLQSVMLLSGGEKALTAIALMFAIFRYKPSPFCLLDEIDAPLDDANIGRFVELLRGMMDRTQFIIITHSRKTMEIANRLYGVTMEEPGVSKLISIQLH